MHKSSVGRSSGPQSPGLKTQLRASSFAGAAGQGLPLITPGGQLQSSNRQTVCIACAGKVTSVETLTNVDVKSAESQTVMQGVSTEPLPSTAIKEQPLTMEEIKKRLGNASVSEKYKFFLDNWDVGLSFDHVEMPQGAWMEVMEGSIPQELIGTYFKNGPGRFRAGADEYQHPYDGDGMLLSVAFQEGRAFFRSAFTRTAEFKAEQRAGKVLFRGSFATQRAGGVLANFGDLYVKNSANTGVVAWGDQLLTIFEAALPYAVSPDSLSTLGLERLGGKLQPGIPVQLGALGNRLFGHLQRLLSPGASQLPVEDVSAGGSAFTAHPHTDSNTGRLCFYTYTMVPDGLSTAMDTRFTFWEVDASAHEQHQHSRPDRASSHNDASTSDATAGPLSLATSSSHSTGGAGGTSTIGGVQIHSSKDFKMNGYGFTHDFAVTANYYILFQPPVYTAVGPYATGKVCAASSVRWRPDDPTLIHIIPRPGSDAERCGEGVHTMTVAPATFVFHNCNAYEDEGKSIIIDSIHYDSLPAVGREALPEQRIDPDAGFRCRLNRMRLDLADGTATFQEAPSNPLPANDTSSSSGSTDSSSSSGRPGPGEWYMEMPAVNEDRQGRKHRYVYGYSSVFEHASIGIAKVDMDTFTAQRWVPPGTGYMSLEPEFIPRQAQHAQHADAKGAHSMDAAQSSNGYVTDEDSGWLICMGYDTNARRSEVLLFDAQDVEKGPIARLATPQPVPHGLHGTWLPTYYGPQPSFN